VRGSKGEGGAHGLVRVSPGYDTLSCQVLEFVGIIPAYDMVRAGFRMRWRKIAGRKLLEAVP
jgi:hypothetical protein